LAGTRLSGSRSGWAIKGSAKGLGASADLAAGTLASVGDHQNLGALKKLRLLSIQSNRITRIEGLENLVNLEELYLSHNGISKLEGLDNNVRLNTLDVAVNRIEKLENIQHLANLEEFWVRLSAVVGKSTRWQAR